MSKVIIRDMESRDLTEIMSIIGETWNLKQTFENEKTEAALLSLTANDILNKSSFGKVAVMNDKVVGFILGSFKGDELRCRLLQEDITLDTIALLDATAEERLDVIEYITKTFGTYEKLIHDKIDNYDGCVEFFAVSEEARGLKIGKKLWNELSNYFKSKHANSIYLYTDTSCNFGFYDHNGFLRKAEEVTTFNLSKEKDTKTLFLYDYQFTLD